MINLTAGRYFLEVTQCQSMRQAADRLHVAPSALSRQIAKLERELGAELLERRSSGVSLTEAGMLLRDRLAEILGDVDRIERDIAGLQGVKTGSITIAAVEGITRQFLAHLVSDFVKENPAVVFRVLIRSRDRVIEALENYDCQIGFMYDHFTHPAIEAHGRWHQPLMAFVPKGHPLASGQLVTLTDLNQHAYVMPDESFGIHQLIIRTMKKMGQVCRPTITSNQLQFLVACAIDSGALVFLPTHAVRSEVAAGTLIPVNLECRDFRHRHISAATRRDRQLAPTTAEFLQASLAAFAAWEADDQAILTKASRLAWKA